MKSRRVSITDHSFTLSSSEDAFHFYPPPPLFPTSLVRIIVDLIHKYIYNFVLAFFVPSPLLG